MKEIHNKMIQWIFALLLGVPFVFFIGDLVYKIIIVENGNCNEYAFPSLSWFFTIFFDNYHYEPNLLYYLLMLIFGVYCVFFIIKKRIHYFNQ